MKTQNKSILKQKQKTPVDTSDLVLMIDHLHELLNEVKRIYKLRMNN